MFSQSAPPAVAPLPRLTALSMLLFGTEDFFAFWMASYSVGLPVGSPPPVRAATSMFLMSLAKSLPRLASMAAFLCFVVAHLLWPLMRCLSRSRRTTGGTGGHRSLPGGRRWPAGPPDERRRSYLRRDPPRRGPARPPRRRPARPRARG